MDFALAIIVLIGFAFLADRLTQRRVDANAGAPIVNDGDTLTVDGTRIRLLGIDAPELSQTCDADNGTYPCGRKAREALRSLIKGRAVTCRGNEDDQYGRLLATCFADGADINAQMVELGWAVAYGGYAAEQADARAARRGIWSGEFQTPRQWRDTRETRNAPPPAENFFSRVGDAVRKWLSSLFGGA